jgi:tetratricopeptide (TPR) repeat protein
MILNFLLGSLVIFDLNHAIAERNFKQAIKIQSELVENAPPNKKDICLLELAFLYLKDQDQEQAFKTFLLSLNLTQSNEKRVTMASPAESGLDAMVTFPQFYEQLPYDVELYKEAFKVYMDTNAESPKVTAVKLLEQFLPILKERPNQYLLDYFVAISYANLGKYEDFFKHFARAYQYYPYHYLAYKTKAILHIKLLERTCLESERTVQRQKIIENLVLASDKEPHDTTIYKLLISFSPLEKKKEQVRLCLNKIINDNIIIPRSELMFYVIEAVETNEKEMAERFIIHAQEWYPQSRIIKSAQKYLDAHK